MLVACSIYIPSISFDITLILISFLYKELHLSMVSNFLTYTSYLLLISCSWNHKKDMFSTTNSKSTFDRFQKTFIFPLTLVPILKLPCKMWYGSKSLLIKKEVRYIIANPFYSRGVWKSQVWNFLFLSTFGLPYSLAHTKHYFGWR